LVNQLLGTFDATLFDECARRHAGRRLEGAREMIEAQLGTPCKVVQVNRPLEIGLNKEVHTPQCRRGEPSAEVRLLGG